MYTPAKFRQHNPAELQAFIAEHPLATLIAQTEHGLEAAHLPLQWHDDGSAHGCLHGHFARANPIWQTALPEQNWLAVFQHSGHYISANWYPGKTQHHKAVPTWNYQAVHIRGRLNIIDDPARVFAMLAALTAAHEQTQPRPWSLADAPADYLAAMSRAHREILQERQPVHARRPFGGNVRCVSINRPARARTNPSAAWAQTTCFLAA